MHGIADPDDGRAKLCLLDSADDGRQLVGDAGRAHARDEDDLAGHGGGRRPQARNELDELGGVARRPHFDANRVGNAAAVLDVRVVQLPRAVADPEKVRAEVVVGEGVVRVELYGLCVLASPSALSVFVLLY